MKKAKILIPVIFIVFIAMVATLHFTRPVQVIPLPYTFSSNNKDLSKYENADILIIGDQSAVELDNYVRDIQEKTKEKLRTPLNIVNWATKGEGLHRTLHKIKSLSKLPKLVIYSGGSEEFVELRYAPIDRKSLDMNLGLYKDTRLLSLIMTFPELSRYIYKNVKRLKFNEEINPFTGSFKKHTIQKYLETLFKLYEVELSNLVQVIRENNSKLILLTVPLNLETRPKKVCENANSNKLVIKQNEINNLLKDKKYKDAYQQSLELSTVSTGNSFTYYFFGISALNIGKFQKAKQQLTLAHAYDCAFWRGHPVFNAIIKRMAKVEDVDIVDFDTNVNQMLGREELFETDITPFSSHYEEVIKILTNRVRVIFNL